MKFTIASRKLGHNVEFSRPGSGYLYVDLSGSQNRPGTLGQQLCENGGLGGNTMEYVGGNPDAFERICRRWWKSYRRQVNA